MLLNPAAAHVISPAEELAAYEALWTRYGTFPRLAELFRRHDHALPSQVQQGRKLSILNSCFEQGLDWPQKFLKKGAQVVDGREILEQLEAIYDDH